MIELRGRRARGPDKGEGVTEKGEKRCCTLMELRTEFAESSGSLRMQLSVCVCAQDVMTIKLSLAKDVKQAARHRDRMHPARHADAQAS